MGYSEPFHLKDVGKNNILLYLVANRFGVNKSYCLALSFNSSFPSAPKEGYVSSHNDVFKEANRQFLPH
ncbi:hypothetical protein QS430_01060 [Staphylococcus pseudintermedius]|nr:hypothetical protein QS430_01060 [Staphylococcus pseudintermedius]